MSVETEAGRAVSASVDESAADWFDRAGLGLFVHWGLYAFLGDQSAEWVLFNADLNKAEYNRMAKMFTAARFDADELAALARRAGATYAVFTTRHHDGFCLFDTETTGFNTAACAAGRDLVAEYVGACRRAGLRVGLYYSIASWQHDACFTGPHVDPEGWEAMVSETHAQVRELMTNYGQIDMLWYDGAIVPGLQDNGMQARFWRSRELNAMVRELQPGILINDRSGLPEDFSTPEQRVVPPPAGRRWHACMTINRSWGYNIHDRDFKHPEEIIRNMVRCARFGGHLLANIGPRADGSIQPEFIDCLARVGDWLGRNGESIYGVQRTPYTEALHVAGPLCGRDETVYLYLEHCPAGPIRLDAVGPVRGASILGQKIPLNVDTAPGDAVQISGFSEELFARGPAVAAVVCRTAPGEPARLLGGGDEPRLEASGGPMLGSDPDHHRPPVVPVRVEQALVALLDNNLPVQISRGEAWCPGWGEWTVCAPETGDVLDAELSVPVAGRYRLEVGLVGAGNGVLTLTLNDDVLEPNRPVSHPGCPDTWHYAVRKLTPGTARLSIRGTARFGLYGLRLIPEWTGIPSEKWITIGPFPTGFAPKKPTCEVRKAMEHVFPPEETFDSAATYTGVDGLEVQWNRVQQREGEYADYGVNFPYRCGTERSGVCFARTVVVSPEDRRANVMVSTDWWANLWVNGTLVRPERQVDTKGQDGAQFSGWKPRSAELELVAGENVLLAKCHPGRGACWFTCRISDPGDLEFA